MNKKKNIIFVFILALAAGFAYSGIVGNQKTYILSEKSENISDKRQIASENDKLNKETGAKEDVAASTGHQTAKLSLEEFAKKEFKGTDFKIGNILDENSSYTRYYITYRSEGNLVSGIMNVPKGDGPFPVLVLNHGYINPAVYTNGRGLKREQDYLARRGYVVVHSDYRNHAESDRIDQNSNHFYFGYAQDVINAIHAIKNAGLSFADLNRIGMLGHSMGGGVAQIIATTKPELVNAFVLFAPVSSNARDNFIRWTQRDSDDEKQVIEEYGSFENNPEFWDGVSPISYFNRVLSPIQIHHGDADESCPLEWSENTVQALKKAGKNAELKIYPGEPHEFIDAWPEVMKQAVEFFDENV